MDEIVVISRGDARSNIGRNKKKKKKGEEDVGDGNRARVDRVAQENGKPRCHVNALII